MHSTLLYEYKSKNFLAETETFSNSNLQTGSDLVTLVQLLRVAFSEKIPLYNITQPELKQPSNLSLNPQPPYLSYLYPSSPLFNPRPRYPSNQIFSIPRQNPYPYPQPMAGPSTHYAANARRQSYQPFYRPTQYSNFIARQQLPYRQQFTGNMSGQYIATSTSIGDSKSTPRLPLPSQGFSSLANSIGTSRFDPQDTSQVCSIGVQSSQGANSAKGDCNQMNSNRNTSESNQNMKKTDKTACNQNNVSTG